MPRPRDTTGGTFEQFYMGEVREARRLEEAVNDQKLETRMRLARISPNSDDASLDKMVNDDPTVKGLIAAQQFAMNKAVMYGFGMLNDRIKQLLPEVFRG
jgi:hypothetical protein